MKILVFEFWHFIIVFMWNDFFGFDDSLLFDTLENEPWMLIVLSPKIVLLSSYSFWLK